MNPIRFFRSLWNLGDSLDRIERNQAHNQEKIMSKLSDFQKAVKELEADVAAENTAIDSAIVLLEGFQAQLDALTPDQASIDALKTVIEQRTQALAAAVAAVPPTPPAA